MRYLHFDVFTDTPFEGNQLAVVPEPVASLTTERMQRIANEMAFSETTFVFPRERAGDVRMRIFTPGSELPMAGHPTIGTTFALAHEGAITRGRRDFVFECGVGPIPVELEWTDGALSFVWMTQPLPSFGPEITARQELAAAIGLGTDDLTPPAQIVSCGLPYLFVLLRSRQAVDRVVLDRRAYRLLLDSVGHGEIGLFVFTTEQSGSSAETAYSRMLAPGFGITEDPATGSASGPLGCYLVHHGVVDAARAASMVSLQGVAMGRPSRIFISIDSQGRSITRVRVGGKSVLIAEGTLRV